MIKLYKIKKYCKKLYSIIIAHFNYLHNLLFKIFQLYLEVCFIYVFYCRTYIYL